MEEPFTGQHVTEVFQVGHPVFHPRSGESVLGWGWSCSCGQVGLRPHWSESNATMGGSAHVAHTKPDRKPNPPGKAQRRAIAKRSIPASGPCPECYNGPESCRCPGSTPEEV